LFAQSQNKEAVFEQGGLEAVIGVMSVHGDDADIIKHGACVLTELGRVPACAGQMDRRGGIEVLLNALTIHKGSYAVPITAATALSVVTQADINKAAVVNAGGVPALLNVAKLAGGNVELGRPVWTTLCQIASMEQWRPHLYDKGCLDVVIARLDGDGDSPVKMWCLETLAHMTLLARHRAAFVKKGTVDFCLQALQRSKFRDVTHWLACDALAFLASTDEGRLVVARHTSLLPALLPMMDAYVDVEGCQLACAVIIKEVAMALPDLLPMLSSRNVIDRLIKGLHTHPAAVCLQEEGCQALSALAGHPGNGSKMVAKGVVDLAVQAMAAHSRNAQLQLYAATLASRLAEQHSRQMYERGLQEACLGAIAGFQDNVELLVVMTTVLFKLAKVPEARGILASSVSFYLLYSLMKLHRLSVKIMQEVLGIFGQLSMDAAVRADLANKNTVDPIVRAMQANRDSAELQFRGLSALRYLSEVDSCKRDIPAALKGAGISVIMDAMRAHKNDIEVVSMACDVLTNLAVYAPNRSRIADVGALDQILSSLKKHGTGVARAGATTLWLLSEDPGNAGYLGDKNGVDALVGIMTTGADPRATQAAACCLANIVAIDKYPPLVIRKGGTLLLVAAMENEIADVDVQRRLSGALWRLAATAEGCAILAKHQRVVHVVVDSLRLFPSEAGLQLQLAGILYELLQLSSATEALVASSGAPQLLVQAMHTHVDNAELQQLCAGVLLRLRTSAYRFIDPVRTGCIGAVLRAMETHGSAIQVQINCAGVLASLADVSDNRVEMVRCNGTLTLLTHLLAHMNSEDLCGHILAALHLSLPNREVQKVFLAESGHEVVCGAAAAHPRCLGVQLAATACCKCLADTTERRQLWLGKAGVEMITTAMDSHPREVELQLIALAALWQLSVKDAGQERETEQLRLQLVAKGILPRILNALRLHSKESEVVRRGAGVFTNILTIASNRMEMLKSNAVDVLLTVMQLHTNVHHVQQELAGAIWNFSVLPEARVVLAAKGATATLLMSMNTHYKVPRVQCAVAGALGQLVTVMESKLTVARKGGIKILVAAMNNHAADARVQREVTSLLMQITLPDRHDSAVTHEIREAVYRGRGLPAVIAVMCECPASIDVQRAACGVLWHLSVAEKHRANFLKHEGVSAVVRAMELYPTDAVVQCRAAGVLWNLAMHSPDALRSRACIGLFVQAMTAHAAVPAVQRCCSGGLWVLAALRPETAPEIAEAGAIPALLAAVQSHVSAQVHRTVCGALKELSKVEALGAAIIAAGGVPAVVLSLDRHRNVPDVLHEAATLLGSLAVVDAAQVAAQGGVAVLVQALQAHLSVSEVDTDVS